MRPGGRPDPWTTTVTKHLSTSAPLRPCDTEVAPDLAAELALARAVLDGRVAVDRQPRPAATGTVRGLVAVLTDASARLHDLVVLTQRLDEQA